MGLKVSQSDDLLKQWLQGAQQAQQQSQQGMDKFGEMGLGQGYKDATYQKQLDTAEALRQKYGENVDIDAGDIRIGKNIDPIQLLLAKHAMQQVKLTPAQEAAEKAGGKKATDYMTGGRASMEASQGQLEDVANELKSHKRDTYDRLVGGALQNHPSLQGFLAPSEKARADKAQQATIGALKAAGIQRPTQWEVQKIFGQTYDPSSSDETNLARITAATKKAAEMKAQVEAEVQNLQKTGYVTPGVGGNPTQAMSQAPSRQIVKVLQNKKTGQKKVIYSDGSEETQ